MNELGVRLRRLVGQTGAWIVARPRNAVITVLVVALIFPPSRRWLYGIALDSLGIIFAVGLAFAIFVAVSGWRPKRKKRSGSN